MKKFLITAFAGIALCGVQFLSLSESTFAQLRPYRVTDNQVKTLLTRIETNTDTFRNRLNNALDSSSVNGSRSEDQVVQYVSDFERSTDQLRERFTQNSLNKSDVEEVLSRASYIDSFMRDYRLTTVAQTQWNLVRTDLNTLAGYYRVTWNWSNPTYYPGSGNTGNNFPPNNTGGNNSGNNGGWGNNRWDAALTGTYRLNRAASDDVQAAVDRVYSSSSTTGGYNNNNRGNNRGGGRGENNTVKRLTPPEMIAIQKGNRQVTIASDMAPQVVLTADGLAKSETYNGRTIRTTTTSQGNGIAINYEGDRTNDFYVTFMPSGNDQLRVVRRVYLEGRNETITVASVYDRTSRNADWSAINSGGGNNNGGYNNNPNSSAVNFIVPDGTRIVGSLETALSTKNSTDGEKFTMKVISPSQYSDAVITGYVSNTERSGRVSGRANMTLNFEEIRLRNGRTYRFAGNASEVRLPNGEKVNITNEGQVRDGNQTTKTGVRAGIGAALGAIIGAVAGGGSGAAIGAAVGAGAGAGTVILQGRDDLTLGTGTEFVITASAPQNIGSSR